MRQRFVLASIVATVALVGMIATSGDGGGSALGVVLFFLPIIIVVGLMGCAVSGVALVLGLPLLLVPELKAWWAAHAWLSWVIAAAGLSASIFSRVIATRETWVDDEGFSYVQYDSPPALLFGGILLLTFGILWAPRRQVSLVTAVERNG